ncbi:MAG: DUF308 domain-containing protein [Methanoregulaceae archaeon]|nr:DUF308 domain-containing protein [Methanoregulaceae archaeon]
MTEQTTGTPGMRAIFGGFFPWWVLLIQGIIALILGIFFLTSPAMTVIVLITFLGAYWFISGIFTLFSAAGDQKDRGMKILLGFLGIILGLAILAYPFYSAFIVPFIFIIIVGVWALVIGAIHIYQGITGGGWGVGIIGLLSVIFGLILLIHPYLATLALPFVLGVLGIVFGFAAIIGAFIVRSKQKIA